jgi:hypothetical protein
MSTAQDVDPLHLDTFGAAMLGALVNPERVGDIIRRIVGDGDIAVGPMKVGPAGIASSCARGRLGRVRARTVAQDDPCRLLVEVSIALAVTVNCKVRTLSFLAHAKVGLDLRVEPVLPLSLRVRIAEPAAGDVVVRLLATGLTRTLLRGVSMVESDLKRHIAHHIAELVNSPLAQRYTDINLHEVIDRAWDHDLIAAGPATDR